MRIFYLLFLLLLALQQVTSFSNTINLEQTQSNLFVSSDDEFDDEEGSEEEQENEIGRAHV